MSANSRNSARVVLESSDISRALSRIAHEILENNKGSKDLVLLGIPSRGVPLANRIAQKINEFEKVNIPIIGIVENMAMHTCSKCGNEEHIFGSGGAEKMCRDYGVSLLGSLPLDIKIREQSDNGNPTVVAEPESSAAKTYKKIARLTAIKVSKLAQDYSNKFPNIVIQKT
mgnify:CR=1 FL=1